MSNVWAFPPEVNRQADFIKHIVIENIRLRDENARLKEERRWIPVSERMPEKSGWYPAWYRHNGEWTLQEDTYYFGNGQWQLRSDGDIGCWHYPLPEPPQEVEG